MSLEQVPNKKNDEDPYTFKNDVLCLFNLNYPFDISKSIGKVIKEHKYINSLSG